MSEGDKRRSASNGRGRIAREKQREKVIGAIDRTVRTVMGCMAIFRLPMTECELEINEDYAYATSSVREREEKGDGGGKRETRTLRAPAWGELTAGQINKPPHLPPSLSLPMSPLLASLLPSCYSPITSVHLRRSLSPRHALPATFSASPLPYHRFLSPIHRTAFFPLGLSPYLSAKSSRIPAL